MDKKGFTLVEIIASIAILGILMVIAGPAVFKIREVVLINSLDSKLSLVKSAAIEFGNDNIMDVPSIKTEDGYTAAQVGACNAACIDGNGHYEGTPTGCPVDASTFNCRNHCRVVSIKTLIQRGYLAGDDSTKESLINPINDINLNHAEVCITFDSEKALERKLVAYIFGEKNLYE